MEVTYDGVRQPLERACSGFDGAVVTVSDSGQRAMVVREGGVAIRVSSRNGYVETDDVEVDEGSDRITYTGTVPVDEATVDVVIEVPMGLDLEPCPAGSSES